MAGRAGPNAGRLQAQQPGAGFARLGKVAQRLRAVLRGIVALERPGVGVGAGDVPPDQAVEDPAGLLGVDQVEMAARLARLCRDRPQVCS